MSKARVGPLKSHGGPARFLVRRKEVEPETRNAPGLYRSDLLLALGMPQYSVRNVALFEKFALVVV
jgi:hypothetical protein